MSEEKKFQVGDRVIYTSDAFYTGDNNPLFSKTGIVGTITRVGNDVGDIATSVMWDNGHSNAYRFCDLEYYISEETISSLNKICLKKRNLK